MRHRVTALHLIPAIATLLLAFVPDAATAGRIRRDSIDLRRLTRGDLLAPARPKAASSPSSATSVAGAVFPGDGAESGPELAYQDNLDGTVTDLNTGFTWEVKAPGGGTCLGALHAVGATCNWNDATGPWIDALNAEGGSGYAGHTDWRIPNVKELQSIVDYGEFAPAIDP